MVGKVLGNRYRVLREVGSGGMAWVYLAEDIKESHLVAVKVLYPQFGEDLSYIHRFNREAKLASAMTDPHIVRVLDYGADRDVYYLVMEYIEGRDLREMLAEKGRYPWRNALDILDQLATALEHAHVHGVVHRDIKPQNLMLDDTSTLKVLDFGIARISTLPSLTQSGFIGSPYYVSPEQAMSEEVDIRSDIYSAGIVLYELLSGNIPFDAKSPWSIISQHIANEPPPIKLAEKDAPETVHQLLNRMVAKPRDERFQTPTALRRAITATLAGEPIPDIALDTRPIGAPDQIDMAEGLYSRAVKAMEAEEWARAADLLSQSLKLYPGHESAREKLALAEHQSFLISTYNTAIRSIDRKAWADSIKKLTAIVEVEPDYKDVKTLLADSQAALEKETTQQLVADRYVEGVSYFESERWLAALDAFSEVQQLSPGYKRTEHYLAEAERLSKPGLLPSLAPAVSNFFSGSFGRWGLAGAGLLAVITVFILLGNANFATGDDNPRDQLKIYYEQAQQSIAADKPREAVALLEQILGQDPDYADAAELRRDLIALLTPTPTPSPTASPVPTPTPIPTDTPQVENPLVASLGEAEKALEVQLWSEAVDALTEIRATDGEFEEGRISSLFCDAYVGRGLESMALISLEEKNEQEMVKSALVDFEAGAAECPRRIDLQDQAERAAAYLKALDTPVNNFESLIRLLTPIVAAEPDYAGNNAKNLLFATYLKRGNERNENEQIVGALGDYEAALALNVDDPSEAQTRRAELILSFQPSGQPIAIAAATPQSTAGEGNEPSEEAEGEESPSPPTLATLSKPTILGPIEDTKFAGKFEEVFLEWEIEEPLAADEYYDLTIMHIFADEPQYWGLATQETQVKLVPEDIGVGVAGNDRFYWWVTVRKANTAQSDGSLDLPRSPQSDARTFVWVP